MDRIRCNTSRGGNMSDEKKAKLILKDIHKSFGEVEALRGVSTDIKGGRADHFLRTEWLW